MEVNKVEERRTKSWVCPKCEKELGKVLQGELIVTGISGNTYGPNFVVNCPECGNTKVWYAQDRLSQLFSEFADHVARKMSK
jgi:RNase P subunit RPR2